MKVKFALCLLVASLPLIACEAKATLVFRFAQEGSDVSVTATGSLVGFGNPTGTLPVTTNNIGVNKNQDIIKMMADGTSFKSLLLTGPSDPFTAGGGWIAASSINIQTPVLFRYDAVNTSQRFLRIINTYTNGAPINNRFVLQNTTFASLGLTPGTDFTYTSLTDSVVITTRPAPGPLPIIGAASAFGISRRLRTRIRRANASLSS